VIGQFFSILIGPLFMICWSGFNKIDGES